MSQVQKSPQPIIPKEKSYSSSRKNQKASSSVGESSFHPANIITPNPSGLKKGSCFLLVFLVHSQPGSGQGSPCVLDQVPSPQSLISSTALVKNEQNQVRFAPFL